MCMDKQRVKQNPYVDATDYPVIPSVQMVCGQWTGLLTLLLLACFQIMNDKMLSNHLECILLYMCVDNSITEPGPAAS